MSDTSEAALGTDGGSAATPPPLGGPRWAVIGIFLILAIHGIAYARAFLLPVVLGVLLALVFSPLRRFLMRLRLSSGLAALLIVASLLGILTAGLLTLAAPAAQWIDDAPSIARELREKFNDMRGATEGVREVAKQVEELTEGEAEPPGVGEEVQRVRVEGPGLLSRLAFTAPVALAQIFFTLILLFFLLASGDMFYEKIVHVMPTFRDKRIALRIARDIERKLSRYFFTITVINSGLGIAVGAAMWALGMPNPALFGVVAAVLNFIPYLGAITGVGIALAVGLVSFDTAGHALLAAAVYFGLTSVEGQIVTPYFVGRSLRLNTVVVFVSVTLWAWLWSVVGMLVATPLLVTFRTLSEHIPALAPIGDFLSARGVESSEGNGDRDP
jgi:predicted PurR-regulated permease PerM